MNNPLITVAIPAYNNEMTIQKTMDSCLLQKMDKMIFIRKLLKGLLPK